MSSDHLADMVVVLADTVAVQFTVIQHAVAFALQNGACSGSDDNALVCPAFSL